MMVKLNGIRSGTVHNGHTQSRFASWLSIIFCAISGAIIIGCVVLTAYYQRWAFEAMVTNGMSMADVRVAAGEPNQVLKLGDVLERWGSSTERCVDGETWIFSLFPKNSNRAVVTFVDGRVVQLEFQYN